ncbi:MAG: alpha-galactosidase [Acidobacteria bacterium]|nr:alpha-galactosidase [Acidobacteriota bacterium]
MKNLVLAGVAVALVLPVMAEARIDVTRSANGWVLSNGLIEASFSYNEPGTFQFDSLRSLVWGDVWKAPENVISSPIRFATTGTAVDAYIPLRFISESTQQIDRRGTRLSLVFDQNDGGFRIFLNLELFEDQPVLRYSVRVRNTLERERHVRMADMLSWNFAEPRGNSFRAMRVNQWSVLPPLKNFEPKESMLADDATPLIVRSGAGEPECAWIAVRDSRDRGLVAGWEFDGRAEATAQRIADEGRLRLSAQVSDLNRLLAPGDEFQVPAGFIGLFHGNWDEAGFRTQRFVEAVLAKPLPDTAKFPYVVWDSWAYQTRINEALLRRNAEIAAKAGVEMFIVDLGWAKQIGEWRDDPAKFPSGLRALSDYVHSLGMKFGLHIAFAEAAAESAVVREHPDWVATEPYQYFGAKPLCLSHKPVQEWVIAELLRVIDEFGVDWVLQDGEHIVKQCTRTDHTHDPADSNYSNAVDGLNSVLDAVQKQRPNVSWENCANGGSMMTFNMVRYYVTSITNDASGALGSRQSVYGATYPFPPRYTDRYMPENGSNTYQTRSYMFGGPWIMMNKLESLEAADLALATSEIRVYKNLRGQVKDSQVFHLTEMPREGAVDAIQGYLASADTSTIVVTREMAPESNYLLKPQGLRPEGNYRVRFQDDRRIYMMTGEQLMRDGVRVQLPEAQSAEIVYLEPADTPFGGLNLE